jgi:hypothetical protein
MIQIQKEIMQFMTFFIFSPQIGSTNVFFLGLDVTMKSAKYNGGECSILFSGPRPHIRTALINERDLCRKFIIYDGADFVLDLQITDDLLCRQHLAQFGNEGSLKIGLGKFILFSFCSFLIEVCLDYFHRFSAKIQCIRSVPGIPSLRTL